MTTHPDIIGKCIFEIDIPDRNKEVWVYDQVSKLAHAQLEIILATVFKQLEFPAQTRIKIDLLELDLGDLPEASFDTALLTSVQRELTRQIQQHLEEPPFSPKDRRSYILEALTFFFHHGRLPWWVSREESAGSIELFFKELLAEYPGSMHSEFRSWANFPHTHRRLAQQLPVEFLKQIIPLLGKKDAQKITKWIPKPSTPIKTTKGKSNQNLINENPNSSTIPAPLLAIPSQGNDELTSEVSSQGYQTKVNTDITPETESVQSAKAAPTGEAEILLYYLERGSFPNGIDRSYQQLNSTILQLIQKNPTQIKQWLLQLLKKANPTARLAQQFSAAAHIALLELFYPNYWPEISTILDLWTKTLPENIPQKTTLDALYKMSLLQLLPTVSPHPDIPQLLQNIAAQLAQRLSINQQELADIFQTKPAYNATERQHVQRAFQRLKPDEQNQLETELQQWSSLDTTEDLAATAIDRILYRLEHGTPAWWDDASQSLDQLVLHLTTLPTSTRREAFVRLYAKDIRAEWLPVITEQTFEQVLHAYWGDYASLVALLTTALNDIALEKGNTITTLDWRETWLSLALSGKEIDSKWLIYTSLSYFSTQDVTLVIWKKALSDYSNNALAAGNIRYSPISSALRDKASWEEMVKSTALEPATKHIVEDAGEATKLHATQSATDADLPNFESFPDLIRAELAAIWRFLQKGVLPVQSVLVSQQDLQQSLQRLLSQYPKLVLPLLQKAMERPAAIARLLDYFPEKTWLQLGKALFKPHFETILTVRTNILHQWQGSLTTDGRLPVERSFWSYIFTAGNLEALVRAAKKTNPDQADVEGDTPDHQSFAMVFAEGWLAAVSRATQLPQDVLWQSLQPHPAQENQSSLLQKIWPELMRRRQQVSGQVAVKTQQQITEATIQNQSTTDQTLFPLATPDIVIDALTTQTHNVGEATSHADTTPETEPVQSAKAAPTGEAQILLYYLERGSFPNGIDRSYQQLNSTILQLIQKNPTQIKRWLLQLFKKANPTARLAQQFSAAAQAALLQLFYPNYWPEISAILDLWTKALPENIPQKTTLDALYKMSLLQLLPTVSPHPDIPQFLQNIAAQMAQRLGIHQQELADILATNPAYNATQRQYTQRALQRLQPDEQTQLETELQQWSSFDTAEDLAATATDRILYRLQYGATAWWDDPSQSLDQLVLRLITLPATTRREAFLRLYAKDVRAKWIPVVSEQTLEQVLHVFLGDYASLVALLTTALNDIALQKGFTITTKDWRETWLLLALSGKEIDSKWLIYKSLLFVSTQENAFEDWEKALSDYTNSALATGDIRFYPISSALRNEQPWEDIGERIALEPAPQQVSEALEDVSKIAETPLSNAISDMDLPNSESFPDLIRAELATIWRFLQKGVLPVQSVLVSQQDLQQSLQRLLSQYPQLVLPLLQKAMARPAAIARLLDYFPEKTWLQLGKALFQSHFETILTVRTNILHQWQGRLTTDGRLPVERSFWSYIFTAGNVEALVRAAKKTNPDQAAVEGDTPDHQSFAMVFAEGWLAAVSRATQLPQDVLWQSLQPHPAQENQSSLLQKIWPELVRRRQQALVQVAAKPKRQSPPSGTASPEDTLLISNAGLVILAPYLPYYFEQLGMLENRVFKDAAAAERGVHLLQYLATAQSEALEQHLVFNKILCGLPLESPVNRSIELSENEISISQSLLEAILQRWEIMKNSTVANLRGAFLLREGILLEQSDRWVLNVEDKAYDIVLEYLPWTISIIKLPWMDKRLEVVWKKKN